VKAVEVHSDIPVRRVTTNEMIGLHGAPRSLDRTAGDHPGHPRGLPSR
jgi:hypothetical protein